MIAPVRGRRLWRRSGQLAVLLAALLCGVTPGLADGVTLKVFGGSSLDLLAPRQAPDVQKTIQGEVIDGFIKAHPEVSAIEWDAQGPQSGSLQRMMTAKLAGQEIDLVACSAYWANGSYVRRGLLKPMTDEVKPFADRIEPTALAAFTVGGKVYGVPITTLSTSAIFYNVDLFRKLGIPVPPTYDDLKAAVPKFKAAGVIPLLHQGANAPLWPMWYFEALAQSSGDMVGTTLTNLDGRTRFDDPVDVEAFALIKRWVDDGLLSKASLSIDQDGMRAAFASGKSAMFYGGTWEIPSLNENVKSFAWDVFPFPKMPGTPGEPRHGGGPDNGICLSSTIPDAKVKPAMEFVAYLTEPKVAALYLNPEQPLATSINGLAGIDAPYAKELRANVFPQTVKFLDWMWPTEVTTATSSAIAGVVGGTLTPQDAAKSVEKAYQDLVDAGSWPPKD